MEHEGKTIYTEGERKGRMKEKQTITVRLYEKGTKTEDIADIVGAYVNLVK